MFSIFIVLSLWIIQNCLAAYNASSNQNVAVYWGQAAHQERLGYYCQKGSMDIVVISFLNYLTPTHAEGNYGNACGGFYEYCSQIEEDILTCQSFGIKVLLSIAGGNNVTFSPGTAVEGEQAAHTLYDMFNPAGNNDVKPFGKAEIDGFDMDLEYWGSGCENKINSNHTGRISLYSHLRKIWTSKQLILSVAPQCVYPDAQFMELMASTEADIDMVLVQFYSSGQCAIYNTDGFELTWLKWQDLFENSFAGRKIRMYPTLQGYNSSSYWGSSSLSTAYKRLIDKKNLSFIGGFGLWDVLGAWNHQDDSLPGLSIPYIQGLYLFAKGLTTNYVTETIPWTGAAITTSTGIFSQSSQLTPTVYVKIPQLTTTDTAYWTNNYTSVTTVLQKTVQTTRTVLVELPMGTKTTFEQWTGSFTSTKTSSIDSYWLIDVMKPDNTITSSTTWTGSKTSTSTLYPQNGHNTIVEYVPIPSMKTFISTSSSLFIATSSTSPAHLSTTTSFSSSVRSLTYNSSTSTIVTASATMSGTSLHTTSISLNISKDSSFIQDSATIGGKNFTATELASSIASFVTSSGSSFSITDPYTNASSSSSTKTNILLSASSSSSSSAGASNSLISIVSGSYSGASESTSTTVSDTSVAAISFVATLSLQSDSFVIESTQGAINNTVYEDSFDGVFSHTHHGPRTTETLTVSDHNTLVKQSNSTAGRHTLDALAVTFTGFLRSEGTGSVDSGEPNYDTAVTALSNNTSKSGTYTASKDMVIDVTAATATSFKEDFSSTLNSNGGATISETSAASIDSNDSYDSYSSSSSYMYNSGNSSNTMTNINYSNYASKPVNLSFITMLVGICSIVYVLNQ